ncbi:MAG: hypothetical protein GY795_02880 [Desulfobacterales bacterium]|nr:hypothetical protein [Desulfobacterales bacterium]
MPIYIQKQTFASEYYDQNEDNYISGGGVISGGFIARGMTKDLGSEGDLINLNGQAVSSDSSTAGGFIYKESGIWKAALFSGTSGHREFTLNDSYQCSAGDSYRLCAKLREDSVIIQTGAYIQLSYVIIQY